MHNAVRCDIRVIHSVNKIRGPVLCTGNLYVVSLLTQKLFSRELSK